MTLITLIAICALSCGFMLYVLVQWVRDPYRKVGNQPPSSAKGNDVGDRKKPYLVPLGQVGTETEDRDGRSGWNGDLRGGLKPGVPVCGGCERAAYERIARAGNTKREH